MKTAIQIECDHCGELNTVYPVTNPYNDPVEPARCSHCRHVLAGAQAEAKGRQAKGYGEDAWS